MTGVGAIEFARVLYCKVLYLLKVAAIVAGFEHAALQRMWRFQTV